MVVDHDCQIVGKQAIATVNNKVFSRQHRVGIDLPAQAIGKVENRLALAQAQRRLVRRQAAIAAVAVIVAANLLEALPGAGAVVAFPLALQVGQHCAVKVVAARLVHHVAVPAQAILFQLTENTSSGAGHFARRVDILDTH